MKIIEAMKTVKANLAKITDLQAKIALYCAQYEHETPAYPDQEAKVKEFLQSCNDLSSANIALLVRIQKTNLATLVPIEIDGNVITRNIAEWVWRRRTYADLDLRTWRGLTDRNLKEGIAKTTVGEMEVKLKRFYKTETRDKMLARYQSEPFLIDSTLEIINATTDLLD